MTRLVDGNTLVALPNGEAVSVAVLAQNGHVAINPASGKYEVPDDWHARTQDGGSVRMDQYGYATPLAPPAPQQEDPAQKLEEQRRQADEARRRALEDASRRTSAGSAASLLREMGLEELNAMVEGWIMDGTSWPEIEARLNDPSTDAGKVVDRIYPELRLRRKNGLAPVSIRWVQDYRTQARQMMRAANLPAGFYDEPSDFTDWIVKDVGLPELGDRIDLFKQVAYSVPQESRDALKRLYGIDENGIAAWYMDEERAVPLLEAQARAADTAGAATRVGYGDLTATEAERLATLGVTGGAAVDAFGTLARSGELFAPLPGTQEGAFGREEQLALISGDAKAAAAVRRRVEERVAATQGGGGFASSQRGLTGLGTAR